MNKVFLFLIFLLLIPAELFPQDISKDIKEIKEKMVTKDEFRLFVESVNKRFEDLIHYMDKRFEDVNRRFEDMHKYMETVFVILGLIQGIIVILLGVIGWRVTKRIKEEQLLILKDFLGRPDVGSKLAENPQIKQTMRNVAEGIKNEILTELRKSSL